MSSGLFLRSLTHYRNARALLCMWQRGQGLSHSSPHSFSTPGGPQEPGLPCCRCCRQGHSSQQGKPGLSLSPAACEGRVHAWDVVQPSALAQLLIFLQTADNSQLPRWQQGFSQSHGKIHPFSKQLTHDLGKPQQQVKHLWGHCEVPPTGPSHMGYAGCRRNSSCQEPVALTQSLPTLPACLVNCQPRAGCSSHFAGPSSCITSKPATRAGSNQPLSLQCLLWTQSETAGQTPAICWGCCGNRLLPINDVPNTHGGSPSALERLQEGGVERQRERVQWRCVEYLAARVPAGNRREHGVSRWFTSAAATCAYHVQRHVGQTRSAQADRDCATLVEPRSNEFLNHQGPEQVMSLRLEYSRGSDWCLGPAIPRPLRRRRQSILMSSF